MSTGLIGKKLGMTSIFLPDGSQVPVTVIEVGPCVVTQVKTDETDGYTALQLAFDEKKAKNTTKPLKGHFEKAGSSCYRILKEFGVENPADFALGQAITVDMFSVGEQVRVSGTSKGRGFSGTVRRHGFAQGPVTHGSHNVRAPGSIGCSAWLVRVFKGKKMPGQYGVDRNTVKNLEVVDIRPEDNLLMVKGAVPGHKMGFLEIRKMG